jgi:hypothetical protein
MQFKALDNVLQTINRESGQKEALSYRCADIDRCAYVHQSWVLVGVGWGGGACGTGRRQL